MIDCYIIRIQDEPVSCELADELTNTLKFYNLNYYYFNAVYKDKIDALWNEERLFFYPKLSVKKTLPGVKGCFLSHFLLWKKCLLENKPILIFEHDALMIRNLTTEILNKEYDVCNLDFASRVVEDYNSYCLNDYGNEIIKVPCNETRKKGYSQFNKASIKGAHSYVIKPSGAKKLIDFTKEFGVLPADIQINSLILDYVYTKTCFCRINPKYWIDSIRGSSNSFTKEIK